MADVMHGKTALRSAPATEGHSAMCVHHWVLGDVSRGAIRGVCRRCDATRTFPAVLELQPSPEQPEDEKEEEAPTLDMPALAAAVSSVNKSALI